MDKDRDQLARLPDRTYISRSQILFNASVHDPQYTVDHQSLGDYAIHFSADWLNGMFSVTDLSPDWVAFIQQTVRGGWSEWTYGGSAPFSTMAWDAMPWDDRVSEWVFSQVRLSAQAIGGDLGGVMDSMRDADVSVWGEGQKLLPFHTPLALPDAVTTTLGEQSPVHE